MKPPVSITPETAAIVRNALTKCNLILIDKRTRENKLLKVVERVSDIRLNYHNITLSQYKA